MSAQEASEAQVAVWVVGEIVYIPQDRPVVMAGKPNERRGQAPCIEGRTPGGQVTTAGEWLEHGIYASEESVYVSFENGSWWLADLI